MIHTLSIIIINYRSAALIIDCLKSFAATSAVNPEMIIVDNSNSEEDKNKILTAYPQAKWINMNYNAGFARANNEGIRQSTGDVVLLLNPDTLIIDNAIDKTFNDFVQSEYIACGVQLQNEDGSPQISGNYAMKGGLNYLLPLPYTGAFIKLLGTLLKVSKPNVPDASDTVEVDWVNGAFLMVKKTAINNAGLLDEDFFLYAEEAEWCSRLSKTGKLCIYGNYKVTHLQGETANDAFSSEGKGYYNLYDRKGLQIMLSNFVRIRKQFGIGWFLFDLMAYTITIPMFWIIGFIHYLFIPAKFSRFIKQAKGFTINVGTLWGLNSKIISNKPYFYKVL